MINTHNKVLNERFKFNPELVGFLECCITDGWTSLVGEVFISVVIVVVDVVVVITLITSFGCRIVHENPEFRSKNDIDSFIILKYTFAASREHNKAVTVNVHPTYSFVTLESKK